MVVRRTKLVTIRTELVRVALTPSVRIQFFSYLLVTHSSVTCDTDFIGITHRTFWREIEVPSHC